VHRRVNLHGQCRWSEKSGGGVRHGGVYVRARQTKQVTRPPSRGLLRIILPYLLRPHLFSYVMRSKSKGGGKAGAGGSRLRRRWAALVQGGEGSRGPKCLGHQVTAHEYASGHPWSGGTLLTATAVSTRAFTAASALSARSRFARRSSRSSTPSPPPLPPSCAAFAPPASSSSPPAAKRGACRRSPSCAAASTAING